jgi:hypothetical protein
MPMSRMLISARAGLYGFIVIYQTDEKAGRKVYEMCKKKGRERQKRMMGR